MTQEEQQKEKCDGSTAERLGLERALQKVLCVSGSFASKTKDGITNISVSGWLQKVVFVMCSWVIIVFLQSSREQPMWHEIQGLKANLQDVSSRKAMNVKVAKGLQSEEAVMQKLWNDLQEQVATVQSVKQEFESLRQKNVDFQDHLTTVLKDLSNGIGDVRQRALPANGMPEANFEKTRFPVLWGAIQNLESRVDDVKAGSDPTLAKKLQQEVDSLKKELHAANQRLEDVQQRSRRERIQAMKDSMEAAKELANAHQTRAYVDEQPRPVDNAGGLHSPMAFDEETSMGAKMGEARALPTDAGSSMIQRNNNMWNREPSFDERWPTSSFAEQESVSLKKAHEESAQDAKIALQKVDQNIRQSAKAESKHLESDPSEKKPSSTFLNK